jgi:hypothetical protein
MSRADYRAVLDRLITVASRTGQSSAEIVTTARGLPSRWQVQARSGTFDVPADWIRRDLLALARKPDADAASRLGDRLRRLRDDVDAYEAVPRDVSAEQARLAQILSRGEFAGVHGPTWLQRVRQRLLSFLVGVLERVFGESSFPTIGRAVVYLLVGLALVALAFLIYRGLRREATVHRLLPDAPPVYAKAWTSWLADARVSADAGRWRDAVRLGYWAAISFLESQGSWPPDRARTPREYLHLLAAGSERRPPLAALTRTFEVVWYGREEANAGTFAATLDELEKLGCRPR